MKTKRKARPGMGMTAKGHSLDPAAYRGSPIPCKKTPAMRRKKKGKSR